MGTPQPPLCAAYFDPAFLNFMSGLVCDEATALQLARVYGQNSDASLDGDVVVRHGAKNFAPRSTGNSTGYPAISSYGGRHVTA